MWKDASLYEKRGKLKVTDNQWRVPAENKGSKNRGKRGKRNGKAAPAGCGKSGWMTSKRLFSHFSLSTIQYALVIRSTLERDGYGSKVIKGVSHIRNRLCKAMPVCGRRA